MRLPTILIAAAFTVIAPALAATDTASPTDVDCVGAGAWVDTASRERMAGRDVLGRAAESRMVLLGETHDNADHHRWQLQTIAALQGRGGAVVLGFEMFPRRVQSVLDDWVAGKLSESDFLDSVGWGEVWGFDPALYMPLFDFARINRVPMVALNIERDLVASIRENGWDAVPEAMRDGVSDPAPPRPAYREELERVYQEHVKRRGTEADAVGLERFIDVQIVWDRAMAEALVRAAAAPGKPLVIGVIGGGHVENGHGVPFQLAALGRDEVSVLLPWDRGRDCTDLTAGLGDAVFGLDPPVAEDVAAPWRPRLGVMIKTVAGVLRVLEVVAGSVAEASGILADDVIVMAAGMAIAGPDDLVSVIGRQAPGTWLPLTLERNGETRDVVAKFPMAP